MPKAVMNAPLWTAALSFLLLLQVSGKPAAAIASELACHSVPIEEVYAQPLDFVRREICTEGVIRFHDGIQTITPRSYATAQLSERSITVSPPDASLMVGDYVSVAGHLYVDGPCLFAQENGFRDPQGRPYTCEDPEVPMRLEISQLSVADQQELDAQCDLDREQPLFSLPNHAVDRWVCAEAIVEFHVATLTIVPEDEPTSDAWVENRIADILATHSVVRSGDLRSGDRIRFFGFLGYPRQCYTGVGWAEAADESTLETYCTDPPRPPQLNIRQIRVLNRVTDDGGCYETTAAALYSDPLAFAERIVCVNAQLILRGLDSPHPIIALVPPETNLEDWNGKELLLGLAREDIDALDLRHLDRLHVRGRFVLMRDCLASYDAGEGGCIPTSVPVWIDNPQIEFES